MPTDAEIDADLSLLEGKVNAVRTYSVARHARRHPRARREARHERRARRLARRHRDKNEEQLRTAIDLAAAHQNVVRVLVGNEVLLRGDLPLAELEQILDRARDAIEQPVGTAETWNTWLAHPELAQHVDFIGVHLLPYWEGVPVDEAVEYSFAQYKRLQKAFPHKPIVVAEIGWPSRGRTHESAVASESNEALFLRRFLRARPQGAAHLLRHGGLRPAVEGLHGGRRRLLLGRVRRQPPPQVRVHRARSCASRSGTSWRRSRWRWRSRCSASSTSTAMRCATSGRSFLAIVVYAAATIAVWVIYDFTQQYMTVSSVIAGVLLLLGMLGVLLVLLAEAHEWAEAHWVHYRRRLGAPMLSPNVRPPKVSIHVPAYNEPPAMLIETLDALARLDYPDFEVLVIDNNTRDEAVWRPVEAHCAALGARFRFFHVAPLAGFKAGALNYRAGAHRRRRARSSPSSTATTWWNRLAARADAGVPGPAHRHRAGAAGLPRRRRERLQGHVLRRVPRLLPHRHDHAQRAQRHHPARHHDHGAPAAAAGAAAGRSGASPRTPSSGCASSSAASMPATCRRATGAG